MRLVLITGGDPAGIGYEIILKAFKRGFRGSIPIVIANLSILEFYNKYYKYKVNLHPIDSFSTIKNNSLNVINVGKTYSLNKIPKPSKSISGKIAIESLFKAVSIFKTESIHAIVTCPVNKYYVSRIQPGFIGHTEFFADIFSTYKYSMILYSKKITVIPVTRHISIKKVPDGLTKASIINSIYHAIEFTKLLKTPKEQINIAVLGLNPHASDNGIIGNEEAEIIKPAIKKFYRLKGISVSGPYSADTFFNMHNLKGFDVIIGMYHDQVLIPFKTFSFGKGVNITYGLPIVRTSVDHGTGYDIVGQGKANTSSLIMAYSTALSLAYKS